MFWTRFVELCNKTGKSPNRVAADLGLSSSVCTVWKKGAVPRDATIQKLADYFHVTADYLLGNVDLPFMFKNEKGHFDIDLYALTETEKPTPKDGSGLDDDTLEQEFMRWFRVQSPERQKDILFELAKAVNEHDE